MSRIEVEKVSQEDLEKKGVFNWPIWEKENSSFDWHYNETEVCYLLTGQVKVTTPDGTVTQFGAGDFVRFPKGLDCVWDITQPVKKHYTFE